MSAPRILLCTVGTGTVEQLDETLLVPLTKSIRDGQWDRVILLPSQLTSDNARLLRDRISDVAIDIRPLPAAGQENNADACFAHFDALLADLRGGGVPAANLLVDFTRGTKAMSAALVLAAVAHGLPRVRYILSEHRDARGAVVPGKEVVGNFDTRIAAARRRLDEARHLFQRGDFAAVLDLFSQEEGVQTSALWPEALLPLVDAIRRLARFAAAWDRLDYQTALATPLPEQAVLPPSWQTFVPGPAEQEWLRQLAQPLPEEAVGRAGPLRWLAADLLANGERRLRDHQLEDALLRAYRVLELIGQFRLADHGLHTDNLPADDPRIRAFEADPFNRSWRLRANRRGQLMASREQAARLLSHLRDPLAPTLLAIADDGAVSTTSRNYSVLIHGFAAVAGDDPRPLQGIYQKLVMVLTRDSPGEAAQRLTRARFLNFR